MQRFGSGSLSVLGEQYGLALAPHTLRHLGCVVGAGGIAADVDQALRVNRRRCFRDGQRELMELWSLVVPVRKVEPHRSAAALATVSVALPDRGNPLLARRFLALELPRVEVLRQGRVALHKKGYSG